MKPDQRLSLAISIVVIIILIIICIDSAAQSDRSLYGMWGVDDSFKNKAKLDAFYIFINPHGGNADSAITVFGTICPMYILIKSDGMTKYNAVADAYIRRTSVMPNMVATYSIDFGKDIDILPRRMSAKMDPVNNMLVLHSGKKMYGRMFKKPEPSFHCRIKSDTSLESGESGEESDSGDSSDSDA
jgi:hypothetical protein